VTDLIGIYQRANNLRVRKFLHFVIFFGALLFSATSFSSDLIGGGNNAVGGDEQIIWRPAMRSKLMSLDNLSEPETLIDVFEKEESKHYTTLQPAFGFTESVGVVRVDVAAVRDAVGNQYVLYVDYPLLDDVLLFEKRSKSGQLNLLFKTGDSLPQSSKPISHRAFVFPVVVDAGEAVTFYFVAKSKDTLQFPISIFTESGFEKHTKAGDFVLGMYFGSLLIMAVFIVLLFFNFRDLSLIYMTGYLVFLAGVSGSVNGVLGLYFFPDYPLLAKEIRIFLLAISMAFTLMFGIEYLEMKSNLPQLYRGFKVLVVACIFLPFANLIVPFYYMIQIALVFCLFVAIGVVSSSAIMLKRKYIPAIYYSIAWFVFIFGSALNVGRAFSLLPNNIFTEYVFQIGALVSIVCLALGIAAKFNMDRANRLRLEKVASEEKESRLEAQLVAQEEKYKSEKAESEAKAKSDFLASMSHEIRTPMNGVLGIAQLLKDTPLDSVQSKFVSTIESSGKTLLGILNDILDYSKIESGKFDIETIPVKPAEVIANAVNLFRAKAEEKGVSLRVEVAGDVPDVIASDPTRLSQIILNLASNAFKFTHEGGVIIRIMVQGRDYIRFEVEDSGIGLSEKQQEGLFQSFCQADQTTTRKYGGTGLGLYISKQLSELMGGEIGVESELGRGSCFWFSVLKNESILKDLYKEGDPLAEREVALSKDDFSILNVLVAEDNSVNQVVIKGYLNKLGITPVIAENGAVCLAILMESSVEFNCVLMDCEMPELDGYDATVKIRELDGLSGLAIIGLSGNALLEQEQRALDAGMDAYLRKPIDFPELQRELTRVVLGLRDK